ncbi:MAG: type II toxin-antitoxin system Phd/YefM family antitoxin [Pyrinomonadaceae bacterium]
MNTICETETLTDFQQNAAKFVKQVQETKQPLILTIDGEPAAVLQDVGMFERYSDSNEYQATVAALRVALDDIENSHNWPTAEQVFSDFRKKYDISGDEQ